LIRIGTRGSALAMAQAEWVAARLPEPCELVRIATDAVEPNDKSRWTSALERALLAGEIDLAVHSAKDVPTELADGLELVAFPERADPRDVICGASSLDALPAGARVGTSSLRRAAQLRALREDLDVVSVRGNVDTRLRKLAGGEVDALLLALAGLERLGRAGEAGGVLVQLVPAAGQGALAVEARRGWREWREAGAPSGGRLADELLEPIRDPATTAAVTAERRLVAALGASCNTPVGAFARPAGDGSVELSAWVGLPDGSAWVRDRLRGPADRVAAEVAERLLSAGAGELLRRAERELAA
jgi:hydroxymethylbilane synthase